MRDFLSSSVITLGFALALWPAFGQTQSDRDFVFTDEDGHLVFRFVGTGATGLDASQAEEVLDQEFSTMVHDRLRADLLFEAEPRDPDFAASMEPRLAAHVEHAGPEFSGIFVDCRAASCRMIMEQPGHWSVPAHQAVLEIVQKSLQDFIAAHGQDFEPVFLITAYDQDHETPHIKAILRRSGKVPPQVPAGG